MVVVSLVVVAILVVAAVAVYLPRKPQPAVVGTPLAYSQVMSGIASAQAQIGGGPWTPDSAIGIGRATSLSGTVGFVSGCTALWESSATIVLPATPSNATPGKVSAWLVASTDAQGSVLLTFVSETSTAIQTTNGVEVKAGCSGMQTFVAGGPIPSSPADSTTVVATADADGGTSFLSDNAVSTTLLALVGPAWLVDYTNCDIFNPSGSAATFAAIIWATNDTLAQAPDAGSITC